MEISSIENWSEIEVKIAETVTNLLTISVDTEKDIYGYFQGMKDLSDDQEIICPHCDKKIDPIEVGLNPQKTLQNWENEDRTEVHAMSFQETREHISQNVTRQIINIIVQIQSKPTGVEEKIAEMESVVSTLTYISELLADLPATVKLAKTNKDVMEIMQQALTDIQKRIVITATK